MIKWRNIYWLDVVLVVLLLLLFVKTDWLFRYSFTHRGVTVYSNQAIAPNITQIIDASLLRLKKVPFAEVDRGMKVFILTSDWERYVFANVRMNAYAVTYQAWHKIFINRADVQNNKALSGVNWYNTRSLESVLSHEGVHLLMGRHFGIPAILFLPRWKEEGYCEYVAGETSVPMQEGVAMVREQSRNESAAFQYFKYSLAAKYLLDERKMSVADFFSESAEQPDIFDDKFLSNLKQ